MSLTVSPAFAQGATLIAVSDASQLEQLSVAKVMARDSSFWLGVRLHGKARLALVTEESALESAPAADAWLRALDFTTRVRVATPPGPTSNCESSQELGLIDSGLPEPPVVRVSSVQLVGSDVELRRALEEAGLPVDAERVARFTSSVTAPFRVSIYEVPQGGGATAALRLIDSTNPSSAPRIELAGRDSVPLSFIALASSAVEPPATASADSSEFPVLYRAPSSTSPSSDYVSARSSWLEAHPLRWVVESQNSSSLFAWTLLAPNAPIAPVTTGYFQGLPSSCVAFVQAAHARGSQLIGDYVCDDHDDLARSLFQLKFADLRLTRSYGLLGSAGITFEAAEGATRSPLLNATDLECASGMGAPGVGGRQPDPDSDPPIVVVAPGTGDYSGSEPGTAVYTDDGGCNLTIVDSCSGDSSSTEASSSDSCSGDSSPSESTSSDSCSGDSSSSDSTSDDSCSGDSSSDSSDDSCSGNSDSSGDSDGCGKNDGYDGDTCSGSSHSSAEPTQASSAPLISSGAPHHRRARRAHLSFLTLLAAALALPLRRWRGFRAFLPSQN